MKKPTTPTISEKPRTVWLVKQTQPDESFIDTTFAVFDTKAEAEKCRKWNQKEYGNRKPAHCFQQDCHFYTVEEFEVQTKFTI